MSIAPPPVHVAPEAPDADAYRAPATELLAILAICASAAGLTVLPLLGSIAGVVLGAVALPRIRRAGTGGRPLAIGGIVLGALGLATSLAVAAIVVVGIGAMAAQAPFGI